MYFLVIHNNYKVFLGPFFKFMGVKGKADILWGSIHLMTSWKPGEKENNLMLLKRRWHKRMLFCWLCRFWMSLENTFALESTSPKAKDCNGNTNISITRPRQLLWWYSINRDNDDCLHLKDSGECYFVGVSISRGQQDLKVNRLGLIVVMIITMIIITMTTMAWLGK